MDKLIIQAGGHKWVLFNEKCLLLPSVNTLIISDLHLGKSSHFRKSGIPLTVGPGKQDLEKITGLIREHSPSKLIFLGDLFHSDYNAEWEMFLQWRKEHGGTSVELIRGNHDLLSNELYRSAQVNVMEESLHQNLCFTHEPADIRGHYNICGHVHPGIKLLGKAKQALKIPCFLVGEQRMILPAFGSLTGLYLVQPQPGETVVGIADKSLIKLN